MKIFEFQWNRINEKEWVAADTIVEALKVYLSTTSSDILDWDIEDEIIELPESEWEKMTFNNTNFDEDEPEDDDNFREMTFKRWMETHKAPCLIAGTMYH